jgi:hypothetical protein
MKFHCCGGGDFLSTQRRRNLIIDLDGAMIIPQYNYVPRAACRMLLLAWERRWDECVRRCNIMPEEAFSKTEHSGRTALHLATFNEGCPMEVAVAMLKANRHAIMVEDRNFYTPLHNLGLFHGGDELMSLFCDTAIMVEQELQGRGKLPTPSRTSPLYLAAKRDAPVSTLRLLMQTRARSQWIAPFTGGEAYWDPQQELDKFSSPLEILLRGRSACFVGLSAETKHQMAAMARNLGSNNTIQLPARDHHDHNALIMWEKCLLLMKESVRTTKADAGFNPTPSLLHTVSSLKVPIPILVQIAMELFPEQTLQIDDTGKYPLIHVLESNHPYATKQLISILLSGDKTSQPPLPYMQECLRLALETGLTWEGGMRDIVMANSEILRVPDAQSLLVPVFLAAALDVALDTIFLLFHAEPQVVLYGRR